MKSNSRHPPTSFLRTFLHQVARPWCAGIQLYFPFPVGGTHTQTCLHQAYLPILLVHTKQGKISRTPTLKGTSLLNSRPCPYQPSSLEGKAGSRHIQTELVMAFVVVTDLINPQLQISRNKTLVNGFLVLVAIPTLV